MAVFSKSNRVSSKLNKSILASGSQFNGTLRLYDQMHVDGVLVGNVFSDNDFSIGESGHMRGFLRARHVIISGEFHGQIDCAILEIIQKGSVHGDVHVRDLRIESGSNFDGRSFQYGDPDFTNSYSESIAEELQNFVQSKTETSTKTGKVEIEGLVQQEAFTHKLVEDAVQKK